MGNVAFEALESPPRLRVADTVGNEQYTLRLDSAVEPEPATTDGFRYPVSDAVRVEISGFEVPRHVRMHLWDEAGELVHVVEEGGRGQAPPGEYLLEFCRPLKTYLRLSSAVSFQSDADGARVRFDSATTVEIGARSPRKQPSGTVTTTDDPRDLMRALSCLGDGLATTEPMRAYPNLRGYPPEIRLGDELDVPEGIGPGSRSATLVLPPDLGLLYEAAPLVYYLNADVRPGSTPRLLVDGAVAREFGSGSFTEAVERLLSHVFMLDCVVRSAGPYPIESVESHRLAEVVPYDLTELYRADHGTRLRSYLEVPFEPVADELPPWPTTAYVEPTPENVIAVPHLVSQLAHVRAVSPPRLSGPEARRAALDTFTDTGTATRASSEVFGGQEAFVDTRSTDATREVWVGTDIPISANDFVVEGFRNRFSRSPTDRHSIDVTIVCNEAWMNEEVLTVREYYDDRSDLPFEVSIYEDLDRSTLADLLATETDFLHYVGHATADGLECRDGSLDVSTVQSVGVETFLLNACQSYQQAIEMVEGGAIGGIATLSDVTDDQAAVVGRTAARLLNLGYPLHTAIAIARSRSVVGGQYLTVGDDSVLLAAADDVPDRYWVEEADGAYEVTIETFQSDRAGAGGLYIPWIESEDRGYLVGKTIGPYELTRTELVEFLEYTDVPVQFDGEFRWAFDLADDLA